MNLLLKIDNLNPESQVQKSSIDQRTMPNLSNVESRFAIF